MMGSLDAVVKTNPEMTTTGCKVELKNGLLEKKSRAGGRGIVTVNGGLGGEGAGRSWRLLAPVVRVDECRGMS